MSFKYHVRYHFSTVRLKVGNKLLPKDFNTEQEARNAIASASAIEEKIGEEELINQVIKANLKVWGLRYVIKYGELGVVAIEDKTGNWTQTNEPFMSRADAQAVIDKAMICHHNNRKIDVEFNRHQLFSEAEYVKL